ncbi:MAG: pilus assembly protein [Actinobacteria bacterium]|nr:pilus assembly protein [Actinomycetota bacterium]
MRNTKESGSAIVEFILLAVPLFLPIIYFVAQFGSLSAGEIKARSLAREIVRAYVSSENEESARERTARLIDFGTVRLNFSSNEISTFNVNFTCSKSPCFSDGGRVRVNLAFRPDGASHKVRVSAEEYVSPWQ